MTAAKRHLRCFAAMFLLALPPAGHAQSLSSATTSGGSLELSSPRRHYSQSGTNSTDKVWVMYARVQGGYYAPHGYFRTYARGDVCGRMITYQSNEGPDGWYTMHAGVTITVPPGCSYRFYLDTNGYSKRTYMYRQELNIE